MIDTGCNASENEPCMTSAVFRYRYQAFGLNIHSEFPCPELLPGSAPADVILGYGAVPRRLPRAVAGGACFQASPGLLLLNWEGISYLACEGSRILIDSVPQKANEEVRLFLLESAFGAILHQRGCLPFHGSAVETKEGGVVFLGGSASGKSALAAALRRRGYRFMADEVAPVFLDGEGRPLMAPAYPRLNLWHDVIAVLGEDRTGMRPVRAGLKKYALPVKDSFSNRSLPLRGVYVLEAVNEDDCSLARIGGTEKLRHLLAHTHQRGFLKGLGLLRRHFELCVELARLVPMTFARHPKSVTRLSEFADVMEKDLCG
jgi:hypothetical protein